MHRLYIIQVCYAVVKEHAVVRREAGMHVLLKLYDMNKTRMRHNKYTATNRSINKRPYVVNLNSALSKHRKYTHGSPYLFLLYEGGRTSWSLDQTLSICILVTCCSSFQNKLYNNCIQPQYISRYQQQTFSTQTSFYRVVQITNTHLHTSVSSTVSLQR